MCSFIITQFVKTNMYPERYIAVFFVCSQNDRYTVGGQDMFDTLTDLVEYYKRKGIEEISGNWVYFKQVNSFILS